MKTITAQDRETRFYSIRATRAHLQTVVDVYATTREEGPDATVAALVAGLGYDTAAETVAELVNTVGTWDARVSDHSRAWAQSVETAATGEELTTAGIYQPGSIHPCHIDQLADAMENFTPMGI